MAVVEHVEDAGTSTANSRPMLAAGTAGDRAEQLLRNSARMVVSTGYARERFDVPLERRELMSEVTCYVAVCTEKLNPDVVAMKSAKDRI